MSLPTKLRVVGLAVTFGLLAGLPFMVDSFLVNLATQALYLGLFALSINLIAGYAGMVTLGQAGVSGIAGYGLGILLTRTTMPLLPALVLALCGCVVVAIVFGLIAVRASGVFFLMITLAEGMIVWGIAQRWTTVTGGDNGLTGIERFVLGSTSEKIVREAHCTVEVARPTTYPEVDLLNVESRYDEMRSYGGFRSFW